MAELIVAFMGLLVLGFSGTKIAKWLYLPHSVFLVLVGIVGGLWLRHVQPETSAELVHAFPEVILLILLPPLIFESAYNLQFSDLKKDLVPISVLAILGLVASTFLVGLGFHFILGLHLLPSLVFGALISATDPVAVVSLFKEIGAPKRLNVLVEGESLLNDGTAIVLFRMLLAASVAPMIDSAFVVNGIIEFLRVAGGGVLVGLVLAIMMSGLLRLTAASSAAQLGLTVAAAYLSFVLSDHFFHFSGVISTMIVGLYLGSRARLELNKDSLHGMHFIWEFLALSANTLVFFAVGLTYDHSLITTSLLILPAAVGIIYFARALAIFVLVPIMNGLRVCQPISSAYQAVLVWGGLRGGLALGLVLILPNNFPHKQLFLAIATAVVAATLFVNALTIRRILHWLHLDRLNLEEKAFFSRALRLVQNRVFSQLEKVSRTGAISKNQVSHQSQIFARELPAESTNEALQLSFSMNSLLLKERHLYEESLSEGTLSKPAYLRLIQSVNSRIGAFHHSGLSGLKKLGLGLEKEPWRFKLFPKILAAKWEMKHLATTLETYLHMKLALIELHDPSLKTISQLWQNDLETKIERFHRLYPLRSSAIQAQFIANTAATSSEAHMSSLLQSQIISGSVFSRALQTIHVAHQQGEREARLLLTPSLPFLLHRVPIFASLPQEALTELASRAKRVSLAHGQYVVRSGEAGQTLYVVIAGMLEVEFPPHAAESLHPKLFTGDFFGEISLILQQPRSASVKAIMPSELIEIDDAALTATMENYPHLRAELERVARARLNREDDIAVNG